MRLDKQLLIGSVATIMVVLYTGFTIAGPPIRRHPPRRPMVIKKPIITPVKARPPRPAKSYLWVPRYKLHTGIVVGGYWRPPAKKGFFWKEGYWQGNQWIPGHWVPKKTKVGYVWVPGYWDGSVWINGHWRPKVKIGFSWSCGHFNSAGVWIRGHWIKK
jgi:hypothetical protein